MRARASVDPGHGKDGRVDRAEPRGRCWPEPPGGSAPPGASQRSAHRRRERARPGASAFPGSWSAARCDFWALFAFTPASQGEESFSFPSRDENTHTQMTWGGARELAGASSGRLVEGPAVRAEEGVLQGKLRCHPGQQHPLTGATEEIETGGDVELHGLLLAAWRERGSPRVAHHGHLDGCQVAFLFPPSF